MAAEALSEAELARAKTLGSYKNAKAQLKNQEWRLDNLYWITDADGNEVQFVRNAPQRAYWKRRWRRDVITKARQLGFSTLIEMGILDTGLFRSNTKSGIIDVTLKDARRKLEKIKFAYDRLPVEIVKQIPLIKANTEELQWANGSSVTVGTTYRGGTLQILHCSEYGKISIDSPETAREIKTGAFRAVHEHGWIAVESTAHGTGGEFYDMVDHAKAKQLQGSTLTPLDYRLHFYGWWMKPEYQTPNNLVVVSQELREYFAKVGETLQAAHGIKLDANQQAWYAQQYADLGPDDTRSEYPSILDECFFNSLEGAYFQAEINKARNEGRIGQMVPFDPTRRVNTSWDIGEDMTAIWFHQSDGVRHRMIDYYEEEGGSLQVAVRVLDDKARERKFVYEKHYGPHDLDNRDWGANAQSRYQTAINLGVKFTVVPRVAVKDDAIEAARRFLGLCWFDAEHCQLGVERLENYRKKWNKSLGVFTRDPIHNVASHGSDALQQIAMGVQPQRVERDRNRAAPERKASQWAS